MATEKKNSWQLKNMSILKLKLRIDRSSLECDNRLTSRIPDPYTTNLLIISETKAKAQHGKISTRIAYAKLYWYCVYPHRILQRICIQPNLAKLSPKIRKMQTVIIINIC